MDAIISVKNLRKVYKLGSEKVIALDNINLDIFKGEVCCILGTSGSGKSTLLNQLAGLEKPSRGQVMIGKTNISKLSEDGLARFRQKNIGFIFQSYNLLTALTALENVSMPLMFRGMDRRKREKISLQMLKDVGLGERARHRPSQMSGGQQQRVGIARAFVARPKIVFADEPTGNLDSKTTIEVMEMMVNMSRENNQTMVLVTHDRELAEYADRIITLIDGNIVSDVKNVSLIDRTDEQRLQSKLDKAHAQMSTATQAHADYLNKKSVETIALDGEFPPTDVIEDEPEDVGIQDTDMVEGENETTAQPADTAQGEAKATAQPADTSQPADTAQPEDTSQPTDTAQGEAKATAQPADIAQDEAKATAQPEDTFQPADTTQGEAKATAQPEDTAQPTDTAQGEAKATVQPEDTSQPTDTAQGKTEATAPIPSTPPDKAADKQRKKSNLKGDKRR